MLAAAAAYTNTPLPTVNTPALPTSGPHGDSPWSPVRSRMLAHGPAREPPFIGLEPELADEDDPEEPADTRATIETITD